MKITFSSGTDSNPLTLENADKSFMYCHLNYETNRFFYSNGEWYIVDSNSYFDKVSCPSDWEVAQLPKGSSFTITI